MPRKQLDFLILILTLMFGLIFLSTASVHSAEDHLGKPKGYGLGRLATLDEITALNIDITPNGEGLPPGQGSAQEGSKVFTNKCASCHGTMGKGGQMPRLVGGLGTLASEHPIKTVGSFWPYATTLFDYIFRAMPPSAPQSLTPHEVYALVAWILYQNKIVLETAMMNAHTLPAVKMPNRNGFVPDPRPDVPTKETP